jgi:hypothetical protein
MLIYITVPGDIVAHIPDITTQNGLLDMVMAGNIVEFAEVLNRQHYKKTVSKHELEEENVMRWRFRLFIKWFSATYVTYVGGQQVHASYIFNKSLIQFAATLVGYIKLKPKSTGVKEITPIQMQTAISMRFRRSHSELFAAYVSRLGLPVSSFAWPGPDIKIVLRDKHHPLSMDPIDIESHPLYPGLWADDAKSLSTDEEESEDEHDLPQGETSKRKSQDREQEGDVEDGELNEHGDDPDGAKDMDLDEPVDVGDHHEVTSDERHPDAALDEVRAKLRKRKAREDENNIAGMLSTIVKIYLLTLY